MIGCCSNFFAKLDSNSEYRARVPHLKNNDLGKRRRTLFSYLSPTHMIILEEFGIIYVDSQSVAGPSL